MSSIRSISTDWELWLLKNEGGGYMKYSLGAKCVICGEPTHFDDSVNLKGGRQAHIKCIRRWKYGRKI